MKLILASRSARRRELLEKMGVSFDVIPSEYEEEWDLASNPETFVREVSLKKAMDVARNHPEHWVLGSDTVVVHGNRIFGKPDDESQAAEMLQALSGGSHRVITGFALVNLGMGFEEIGHEITEVTFASLSRHEIDAYISTGDPMDKAGAYGIQGYCGMFITGIKGCYFNVVGLPVRRVYELLSRAGMTFMHGILKGN
ncbi:MAG: septum formation inhibitor Maf [Candidatus Wallbacteria bacterium HGW-Wallbacteria-1]|jgi:septum formation protein|uniref:dTTP/UTP pyrophosphatase n=1 Tax=Candidatus Wallbacteria bacterium HGW-Wallbacteria-1 TaxID=2013854 RepID=A0A2N1PSZ2_9BACT|nr:MAG: septum formation inhibitor Maf [Candidatus Wallbacteria bacterium HGW-Wallbacteria-1]